MKSAIEILTRDTKEMVIVLASSAESANSSYYMRVDDLKCVFSYITPLASHYKSVKKNRNY